MLYFTYGFSKQFSQCNQIISKRIASYRLTAIDKLRKQRKKEQQVADEKREQRALDDLFVVQQLFEKSACAVKGEV